LSRAVGLGSLLFAFWFILSGHLEAFFLGFGVLSCAGAVWVALRMEANDGERVPLHVGGRFWRYFPWLMKEIFVANLKVARLILTPSLPISPMLVRYRGSQRTDLGRALYANSITLTPGTITIGVRGSDFLIHSLTRIEVEVVEEDEMDRRCTWVEQGARS
jgi:multicomponent Na+:H+ antiporter subunit E